jgi:hypothetical protein
MYHVNPAVTKALLMRLDKAALMEQLPIIKQHALESEPGSTRRAKFIRLYQFTIHLYNTNYQKPRYRY